MSDATSIARDAELLDMMIEVGGMDAFRTTYTAPAGSSVTCRLFVDDVQLEGVGDRARTVASRREVQIALADVAAPVRGAVVVIDGANWRLSEKAAPDSHGLSPWVVTRER